MAGLSADTDVKSILKAIELINQLALELDVDAAMESVRNVVLELLDCDRCTLFLMLDHRKELRGRTGDPADNTITVKFGEGIAGSVAISGELMNIADAYQHPLFNAEVDRRTGYHTRSILCCAISDMSGKSRAVLQALNKRGGAQFTTRDEHVLQLTSVHLGNTLAKARLHEEAKREKQRLATLSNCFKRMNKVTSLMGALDTMTDAVHELVCAQHIVVFLKDQARGELWTNLGDPAATVTGQGHITRTKKGVGVVGRCAAKGQQQLLRFQPDEDIDDHCLLEVQQSLPGQQRLRDVLMQPVMDPSGGDTCLAVLVAINKNADMAHSTIFFEDSFTPSDCDALGVFSMEVADILVQRSLEVSFASALSVVGANGAHASANSTALGDLLRAQLMVYSQPGIDAFGGHPGTGSPKAAGSSRCTSFSLSNSANVSLSKELDLSFLDAKEAGAESLEAEGQKGSSPAWDSKGRTSMRSGAVSRAPSRAASIRSREPSGSGAPPAQPLMPLRSNVAAFISSRMPSQAGDFASSLSSQFDAESARELLLDWSFECADARGNELVKLAFEMFMLSGVVQRLQISERTLSCFLSAVASHYHPDVPYHNFNHAVMVLHTVWMMLETTGVRDVLTATEELVLMVAALCHDLDHDGHSNSFHINAGTELAQRYNDRSVLENHHCALTFAILRKKGANIFEQYSPEEWRSARRLLIEAILNTDMGQHFTLTNELQKHGLSFDAAEEADRALLVKILLHAADISNPVRPFHSAAQMAERVQAEFAAQVSEERSMGLPVAPHMDVSDPHTRNKMELHFIDYIVGPLWERLAQVFPTLQPCITQLRHNRQRFAIMAISTAALPSPHSSASHAEPGEDAEAEQSSPAASAGGHASGSERGEGPATVPSALKSAQRSKGGEESEEGKIKVWREPKCVRVRSL